MESPIHPALVPGALFRNNLLNKLTASWWKRKTKAESTGTGGSESVFI